MVDVYKLYTKAKAPAVGESGMVVDIRGAIERIAHDDDVVCVSLDEFAEASFNL